MRLLDARALIHEGVSRLVDYAEVGKPDFAILSHTWGLEEILFEDIALGPAHEIETITKEQQGCRGYRDLPSDSSQQETDLTKDGVCKVCRAQKRPTTKPQGPHSKAGWKKIWSACLQACRDDYDYIWIDTCCIDKSSSTELAEALNSMFKWYTMSAICYVLLEDCRRCLGRTATLAQQMASFFETLRHGANQCTRAQIRHSRWLTRCWTLQELIAPAKVEFFDRDWTRLGTRTTLLGTLTAATGINASMLDDDVRVVRFKNRHADIKRQLRRVPVATKMSWAAKRSTTRVEDRAYSLLGLFNVSMPLLYGEGKKAFIRLQEEIIRHSNDDSIFAWEHDRHDDIFADLIYPNQLLAPSPAYFLWWSNANSNLLLHEGAEYRDSRGAGDNFEMTQKVLDITLPLLRWRERKVDDDLDGRENKIRYKIESKESNLWEDSTNDKALVKLMDSSKESSENTSLVSPVEEYSDEESSPQYDSSENEVEINFKESQALLNCYIGVHNLANQRIYIALRLSHKYRGGKYVISETVNDQPGRGELDGTNRRAMGIWSRYNHRLALYYYLPPMKTQSIRIRRMNDMDNI